ncbi:virion structural protein [Synechococcus phage S-H9-1]|uniref:Tail fiber-like protein n=1 Tax=Synechococcus phage S-H9-1 TaxID=2783674 RepID=A0A873WA76_9CAUD|nr:virion structural protein [Synechococcus phage S-H9-1]QPB08097.1 tail fiber-like protein [Synechococcus phage S-H9-1]
MPLTRLDNLITSKTGKYLYVSPDDFNASDELNNRGNSPVRPFKSIQRAFLEVARYSYLPGKNNDRFDQFTIMLMPGEHFIDNRPGLVDTSGIAEFGFDLANNEWTDNSILDLSNPDNVLYKFNNTEGGAIIPRGTSLVGYDLRRTMVKPLYVPDPADSREPRSAIFNVTGGCYFWQFTIKDGETTSLSPLYNSTEGIGKVYYSKDDFTKLATPNYSHHKLTVFEYADKQELELLYRKIAKAFAGYQPTIDDADEFAPRVQENRIVGPLSDSRQLESIKLDDSTTIPSLPGSTTRVEVTTKIDHGYFQGQFVAVTNTNIDDILEGTFQIESIDQNDPRKFTYLVPQTVNSIGTGIVSGDTVTATFTPPLGQNAQVLAEVDSVESASPYVFNCSIRSTWGICGIWANGLKATGFKSMVIAQYTGVSLQKDDRAFIRYDEFTNTWNQANLTDAFDSIPYHTKGDSYWKDEWRNFHVRASEDAFIQNVSIFAVGFADHFLMESGGDMSITNSNSNFGNTSLHAIGHKGFSFNSDKGGYIDAIIPPKIIETTDQKINYYPFNVPASISGVEGVQQQPISGVRTRNDSRLYIDSQDDALDPAKRPAVSIEGYRLGARQNEKIYTTLETAYQGDDGEYEAELAISGYRKYVARPSILSPSSAPAADPDFHLKQDAANMITSNKTFIQEEVFGYVLEKYPALQNISYVNPGLDPAANRYYDARNLILSNRSQIIDDSYALMYAAFGPAGSNELASVPNYSEATCKRDIGYIVDAIAEDLRDGGNANIIEATKAYFNPDGTPLQNGLLGEEKFGVFAFNRARDLCKQAIANLLLITDGTVTVDPANAVDPAGRYKDARNLIVANKSDIIDSAIAAITTSNPAFVFPGGTDTKCRRDLGLIVDGIAQDLWFGGNEYTVANVIEYFEGNSLLSNGVAGEVAETVVALQELQAQMELAVTNQLAVTDLTITPDPVTGSNTDPASCADVRSTIGTLVDIFVDNLNAGNLNALPAVDNGNWDCANVRATIDNLTDILTDAITAGSLTGLPDVNEGDFIVNAQASKCYRDVGYIVDAVVNDLKFGGNINSVQAGEAYYVGNNLTYIDGEKNETLDAWGYVKTLAISAMRQHTTQINGCNVTSGSAIVNVGSNVGLSIGMKVEEYAPSAFDSNGQLIQGSTPLTTNIPSGTYIKQLISTDQIELGIENSRLTSGQVQNAIGTNTNASLYFTLEKGQWADTDPSVDYSILNTNAGYPECAGVASAIDTLVDNIIFIINNGLNSVQRQEPTNTSSDFSSRSTIWTVDVTGLGSTNPHQFETGTPVRLVPRPRWDNDAQRYVDVDKRLIRLPNGFETNRTYFVIAPGRVTEPFNYAGSTEFSGNASNNVLMLAESKENAAAGIYIFSSESDSIDADVEIDMLQFTLDEKYDLHTYKCTLDPSVNGGIKTNIAHIFDVPYSNVTPQRVFFRAKDGFNLPLLSATYNTDNASNNGGDSTAGVADSLGRLNPEYEFYVRYVYNQVFPNKVLCVYKTHADAINDVNRINFSSTTADEFILYGSKKNAPLAFDPRGFAYSNSTTGRWYVKVKDTSSTANALSVRQESILWRFQESDYLTSPPPKTDDSFYFRQVDARDPKDRIYRVRYTIPKYLEGVRDPINGFVLKTRTDSLRKLRPQKILLKPAPGTTKTDAFFENTNNSPERIGWTNQQIINAIGDDADAYDPYRLDTTGAGIEYAKKIVTKLGKVQFTIQSGKLVDVDGQTYLELVAFDFQPDPSIAAISNEVFRTVKIGAPQGGLFNTDSTQKTTNNAVTWAGNSSGSAWIQAYFNVGSDHYLILKGDGIDGNLTYSAFTNTRFTQGSVYADLLDDPDMGKSLPLKTLIEKNYSQYYYRQNRAPVYTLTPGDTVEEDGSNNQYYIEKVEDLGEIEDTFYIFDIDTLQRRISGQQDGVYYLTLLRGNISPFPQGAGNQGNFRNFKFSQPISFLYPQNYKNDPFWFKYNGTTANELAYANTFIDPPATYCAADNYVHGLVTTNDSKSSVSREMIADLTETPAFALNTYTGDNAVKAQEGNASAGAEDRIIPLSGDNRVASQQKFYVELRRPSIARAGNHTFEYLGFGPGNYSTGLPARQEIVLTATQDYYAQAKRQDAGIVFYTGINSNGELYIGNRKINAITGEEEFLEKAALLDSDDDEDDIGSLVTTFDVPVTFNQNITVNGGDGEKVSAFNSPVLINVDNADLTLQDAPIVIRSRVNNQNPDASYNDPLLDRSSFNPRDSGDIFLGKNYVRAAVFQFNPRRNGQDYKIQTHTTGTVPSNITPNQSGLYSLGLGGTAIDADQRVFYGSGVNGVLPQGGDILLKGDSVQRSGSLGWIFSNYYVALQDQSINSLNFGGVYVKINWANVNGTQQTNQLLGINETSSIRISNFFPTPLLEGTFPIVSPTGDGFAPTNSYCHIQISETLASIVYNDSQNVQQTDSNPAWSVLVSPAVLSNNNVSVAPSMEFSNATWKEVGVLGAETLRTDTETIGNYKLGVNTVARSSHAAYETAFVDAATDPRANLDVVGTTFISGKTIGNYLDHALFSNRTETAQDNALLVGGNSASPDNEATLRVSTTNGGRVGINVTNLQLNGSANNGLFNQALAVDGNGFISGDLRVETDLAVNGGDLTTTQTTFNLLEATVTTLNFANDATTVNAFNDATGTQTINVGGSTDNQTLNIGTAADTSRLNIHTTSEDSEINIGTVPNTTNTFRSLITIGGAFANAAESRLTVESFQTVLKSSILEINNGLTSTTGNSNALVELQSNARKIDLFTRNGAGAEINAFTRAVALNMGAIAGQTQINNALRVLGDTTLEGDVVQNGGNNNGAVQVVRGVLGTTAIEHNIGDLQSLNVDFYSFVAQYTGLCRFTNAAVSNNTLVVDDVLGPANYFNEGDVVRFTDITGLTGVTVGTLYFAYNVSGQTLQLTTTASSTTPITISGTPTDARLVLDGVRVDSSGQGGSGTLINSTTTTLPLNNVNSLTVGDLLLIDNEIIRVVNPPSVANRTVVVERGIDCTTAASHLDNAFVAKLIFTQDATFIREGDQGPSDITLSAGATQIELGEFGGTFKPLDFLRLSAGNTCPSGEFVRITAILNAAPERFRINDGANNDRFVVDSVTGDVISTLVTPATGAGTATEDFQIQLTTTDNRFVIERDTNGTERLTIDRDGRINLIGDGTAANPAATLRGDGTAAFTGDFWITNTHAQDTSLNNGRLRLTQTSGDLDIAGGLDMDGQLRIYSGSTGINFTGTPVFQVETDGDTTVNNLTINGQINIGGITNYITETGARKWLIIDTPSNSDSTAPTLAANTNYFVKPAGTGIVLVLKLPSTTSTPPVATGDMIRLIDIAGNLSYNCQLIVRAPSGVNIQGDATGTTLGGLNSAHTGGELIINTPNVGLGLVYIGSTDADGTSIGSQDQGWRIVEV